MNSWRLFTVFVIAGKDFERGEYQLKARNATHAERRAWRFLPRIIEACDYDDRFLVAAVIEGDATDCSLNNVADQAPMPLGFYRGENVDG